MLQIGKYRKRPVEICAVRVTADNAWEVAGWCGSRGMMIVQGPPVPISTLEGVMLAEEGDWVIRGVKGEFYPCKPDIFAMSYDAVDSPPQ